MIRGTFANIRLRNQLAPGTEGGWTRNFATDGEVTTIYDAAQSYAASGTPIQLDDVASLGHVDIELLDDGSAAATFVEVGNQQARLRVRRVEASGAKSAAVTVSATGARPTGVPRIARVGDELLFAWTESTPPAEGATEGTEQVKTATARLPGVSGTR